MYHWDDVTEEDFQKDENMALYVATFGLEQAKKYIEFFGGDSFYVPKAESILKAVRDRQIFSQYQQGIRYRELAAKYNLTTRHIREIVRGQKALNRKIKEEQLELPL